MQTKLSRRSRAFCWLLLLVSCFSTSHIVAQGADDSSSSSDELGQAASLFTGPVEVVAEHEEFGWLEGPVWSESGQFVLFSDVKWEDENNITCGMIWKYDNSNDSLSKFVKCSGLIGPGDTPATIEDYVEAGSNGLEWGWKGEAANDLIICQHGKHRIVRINLNDVNETSASIDPGKVTVFVDSYKGKPLNSPNDVVLDGDTAKLYFTDPPFGLQFKSSGDQVFDNAFANLSQDAIGVYTIGDPGTTSTSTPVEPFRVLDYGNPTNPWEAPNGVAVLPNGDMICPITSFEDPRFEVFAAQDKTNDGTFSLPPTSRLETTYRIQGANSGMPALNDGMTYSPDHDVLFGAGPGGVYMFNGTTYELLGFLRLDDLIANNVVGGGFLWMTANQRLLRIPLVNATTATMPPPPPPPPPVEGDDQENNGGSRASATPFASFVALMFSSMVILSNAPFSFW